MLSDELLVAGRVLAGDAEHHRIHFFESVVVVAEGGSLQGTARGIVFRIEEDQHELAFEVAQGHGFPVLVLGGETGRGGPGRDGHEQGGERKELAEERGFLHGAEDATLFRKEPPANLLSSGRNFPIDYRQLWR